MDTPAVGLEASLAFDDHSPDDTIQALIDKVLSGARLDSPVNDYGHTLFDVLAQPCDGAARKWLQDFAKRRRPSAITRFLHTRPVKLHYVAATVVEQLVKGVPAAAAAFGRAVTPLRTCPRNADTLAVGEVQVCPSSVPLMEAKCHVLAVGV